MVGPMRFELMTSRLSAGCSNQPKPWAPVMEPRILLNDKKLCITQTCQTIRKVSNFPEFKLLSVIFILIYKKVINLSTHNNL